MGVPCFGIILWTWRLPCWAGVFRHPRSSPCGVFTRDKWLLTGRGLLSQGETPIINVGCSSFLQAVLRVLISLSLTHVLPSIPPIVISSGISYPDLAPLGVKRSFMWLAHHCGLPHSILLSSVFLPVSSLDPYLMVMVDSCQSHLCNPKLMMSLLTAGASCLLSKNLPFLSKWNLDTIWLSHIPP